MPLITCSQCGKDFEDEILCCPHCGAAQIPQLSKAELRLANMKASKGPLGAIYLGFAVGLLLGVAIFTIAAILGKGNFGLALSIPAFGVFGSGAGFLYHRFFHERRP
jgi:hypothetical protein